MYKAERTKNVVSGTRGIVYKEALRVQAEGNKVLKMNTGNPAAFGFPVPDSLKKAIAEATEKAAAYSESTGIKEAKEAILAYDLGKGFKNISVNDIFLGNGVSELAEMICSAMIDPGDEVLCPCPNYNLWTNSVLLAEGKPVFYECFEEKNWMPDADEIESHVTDKTKVIVIINPNNPTGALYSDELLLKICDVARRHGLVIFADEIYDRLLMDGAKHSSIAALAPDIPVMTFNGLSKSHIVCGFRCGWMTASGFTGKDGEEFKTVLETLSSVRLCSNTFAQFCVPAALADPVYTVEMMSPGGRIYERREATINAVNEAEYLSVVKNTGALYCFVRIDPERVHIKDGDDKQFAMEMVRDKHVMVVPGSGFDYPKPNYFRVVMLPEPEELAKAIKDIDDFCRTYDEKHYH
ncbi:MAG: aminotransferase class I/II-fold pyridoxal phosphate-dependent enzyme [Firmicutes bacterium]|nr:aminotransferase class I/II-fold pyridoxal phosphate-dependent enzyme [Bacillota bacterium]